MSTPDWDRKVFRLRRLPDQVSTPAAVASLLSNVLVLPPDHIVVHSVARAAEIFEVPSRTATLQIKSVPTCLKQALADTEWSLPLAGGGPGDVLVLDTHFEGITVLHDPPRSKHIADCIAVSGLASHPFGSWQPHGRDKTFMWIRDALPTSLSGVRTVLYGYGSKLPDSKSFQSIGDIARTLILHLKTGGWNLPSSKPVVFLAHSLGGIVLKEAIVQMADRDETISGILANVRGAIMFGVPSLGMEQSHLIAMVEGQANQSLVEDLSRYGGNYVRQLHTQFEGLSFLRKARLLWAYETEESPTVVRRRDGSWDKSGPRTVLVNPASATSNYIWKNKSVTIPIHKDHSSMVKFTRGDANLGIIMASVAGICTSTHLNNEGWPAGSDGPQWVTSGDPWSPQTSNRVQDDDHAIDSSAMEELKRVYLSVEEMYDGIFSPELDFRVKSIEDPFENTFKWVFELPAFSKWLQDGSGLFWIYGKPGSGKSTLMKLIFQSPQTWQLLHNWQGDSLEISAGYFFHYRGSAIQKSFEGVLRGLIVQILTPVRDSFRKKHKQKLSDFEAASYRLFASLKVLSSHEKLLWDIRKALSDTKKVLQRLAPNLFDFSDYPRDLGENRMDNVKRPRLGTTEAQVAELELRKSDLEDDERRQHATIQDFLRYKIEPIKLFLAPLANHFNQHIAAPETKFLKDVANVFRGDDDQLIPKLERILRHLLDQNTVKIDLVLFFDALDEFDGHPNMISRFMKSLLSSSPTSATRVKVCLSSRPWEAFKIQFSSYPSFALQDYTKNDIEAYVVGTLAAPSPSNQAVLKLAPTIIQRANGVFLWVKLAIRLLLHETTVTPPGPEQSNALEKKLEELPGDLFEFYELIVERISKPNRRRTFALLELLIRHDGPSPSAKMIRDATYVSECTSVDDATQTLEDACYTQDEYNDEIGSDIHTWSGGLVEVKLQDGGRRLQLMHQTVLEFAMGLGFKEMVVGDFAAILQENGHTFHLKYLLARRVLEVPKSATHVPRLLEESQKQIAYHAEQSELTTGKSNLGFLSSAPHNRLYLFRGYITREFWSQEFNFLSFAASFGLTLCIRDWIESQKDMCVKFFGSQTPELPLLSYLIFYPMGGVFHDKYLTAARLLLENGFETAKDPDFFPMVLANLWMSRSANANTTDFLRAVAIDVTSNSSDEPESRTCLLNPPPMLGIPPSALASLATLALEHGQDPNIVISASWDRPPSTNVDLCTWPHPPSPGS